MKLASVLLLTTTFLLTPSFASPAEAPPALDPVTVVEAPGADPEIERQVKGNYPPLERAESVPLGAIQRAWDHSKATDGVYVVNYIPHQVMRIRTRRFMTTTIVLPTWEKITKAYLGDPESFQVHQQQDHLFVFQPEEAGLDTNLTLVGESGNIYSFYVRAEDYNSQRTSDFVVKVQAKPGPKPRRPAAEGKENKPKDYLRHLDFNPSKLDFAFTMSGDRSIAPRIVYTDGIFTWFEFGEEWDKADMPTVYRVVDGVDTPINTRVEGTKLIAETAGSFSLKNGQRVVCVIHDSFNAEAGT